jgi:long-chain fatty acid transport protein
MNIKNQIMKKTILALTMIAAVVMTTYAGGLLTNTNQSAQFVRMLSRNASTQIDAVYFNPAGLAKLEDGWHFALHNQSIFQEKPVNSEFPLLNNGEYIGKVKAPVFPNAYAVYKNNNWAFSLGFGPVGGGGSATFDRGLPSFEIPITKLVPGLAGLKQLPSPYNYNVSGYDADLYFDGSSIFWGIQVGATYKFNDVVSGYAGVRYMPSTNTYNGSIQNIQLNVNGAMVSAPTWMKSTAAPAISGLATAATGGYNTYNTAATGVQQIVAAGAGSLTIALAQTNGIINATQKAQFEALLANLGKTPAEIAAYNMTQINALYTGAATTYQGQATQLSATALGLAATANTLGDKKVETKQTGAGWTPILGANFNVNEKLNVGIKYEFKTRLELTNSTPVDDLGLFPDGGKSNSDIPAILAVGIGYKPADWLETQLSYNIYFDKGVDWGNNVRESVYDRVVVREIDKNYWELALGLQFNLSDKFAVSIGGMRSKSGIADSWQSDFDYSNPAFTAALGIQWKISDKLTLDAGAMNVFYQDVTVTFTDPDIGKYNETYGQTTTGFALGLSYSIFK